MADKSRATMDHATADVMDCEKEIQSIKSALKSLVGLNGATSSLNRLRVSVHKMAVAAVAEGGSGGADPDATPAAAPTFKIRLSAPAEERTLTRLRDPLDPAADGSLADFESVETSSALLTVEVYDGDGTSARKLLGESAPHELLPLCQCQEIQFSSKGGEKKISSVEMAIVAAKGTDDDPDAVSAEEPPEKEPKEAEKNAEEDWEDALSEETEEGEIKESPDKGGAPDNSGEGEKKEAEQETATKDAEPEEATKRPPAKKTAELQLPLYTLTVHLEYTPSPEDKRDALYQQLNEVSKRKVAAIEVLRKSAAVVNRAKVAAEGRGGGAAGAGGSKGAAVKSGFLNKAPKAEATRPPLWKRWYEKALGPQSMVWVVVPAAKDYVLFVGVSLFIHFKGGLLALPPPL